MRIFLWFSAAVSAAFAAALLALPSAFYAPLAISLSPQTETIAQAHGATLAGLALATLLASFQPYNAMRPILAGNLTMQALSLAVALRIFALGAGMSVMPALVIHSVLGCGFAVALMRSTSRA